MNADLSPQQSSSDAAVGYEAAQEAINGVLACYVALLEREGQKTRRQSLTASGSRTCERASLTARTSSAACHSTRRTAARP